MCSKENYFNRHDHGISMIRTSTGTGRISTRVESNQSPSYGLIGKRGAV
jgi:hypothetical protein